jgi:hypothetical protein
MIIPFLTVLFNRSLSTGTVPTAVKEAYITPLLNKADLDSADVRSYQPISNLTVISKLLECLGARQLIDYLHAAALLRGTQSVYQALHSTETAMLKVLADILRALDTGNIAHYWWICLQRLMRWITLYCCSVAKYHPA